MPKRGLQSQPLLLGFNEFFIEPYIILEFDYGVIKQSKTQFIDTIRITKGSLVIKKHSGPSFQNHQFTNKLNNKANPSEASVLYIILKCRRLGSVTYLETHFKRWGNRPTTLTINSITLN